MSHMKTVCRRSPSADYSFATSTCLFTKCCCGTSSLKSGCKVISIMGLVLAGVALGGSDVGHLCRTVSVASFHLRCDMFLCSCH